MDHAAGAGQKYGANANSLHRPAATSGLARPPFVTASAPPDSAPLGKAGPATEGKSNEISLAEIADQISQPLRHRLQGPLRQRRLRPLVRTGPDQT